MDTGLSQEKLGKSFAEFVSRPENQPLAERAQREEIEAKLRAEERLRFLEFKEKAEVAGAEVISALEPFLHHKVLRRIVTSFSTSTDGSIASWACNPRVQAMLSRAKQMLEEGSINSKELEHHMLQHLKAPGNPSSREFKEKARAVATLPTELLVGALNEHLSERRTASKALQAGKPAEALVPLQRALAILNIVQAQQPEDQKEIVANKVSTLRMLASTQLALQQFGAAAHHCTEALELDPCNALTHMLRARARLLRREYSEAEEDMSAAVALDPEMDDEAADLEEDMRALKAKDHAEDKQVWYNVFSRRK